MNAFSLDGAWQGRCIFPGGESFFFDAQVPGSSLSDLIRAGRLPEDLFWRDRADAVSAYERCDFEYSRSFSVSPAPGCRYALSFQRLDTYCDVFLNGELLLSCQNEHIPHEADVTGRLRDGENQLRLFFHSPVVQTEGLPARPGAFTTERLYTRRTQCTYGWDWVALLIACGISGPVRLLESDPSQAQIRHGYVYTQNIDEDSAQIGIELCFASPLPCRVLTICVFSPDGSLCRSLRRFCGEPAVSLTLDIPSPCLWHPLGYGRQDLYRLAVLDGEEELFSQTFGVRTVKILQLPDAPDSPNAQKCRAIQNPEYDQNEEFSGFILKVNGQKILCKGANWVPCQPFYMGSTDEKVTRLLELAAESGLNMLRIWGGGTFETAHFYRECSRLGIMVTQDFLMACGQYPEAEEWFLTQLRKEAEFAALHIRNEPCLMWWSGDNENAVEGCDLDENYSGRRSALFAIGPVLKALDPCRAFLPSSPYGGRKYASNTVGTTHNTQFLGCSILPYMLSGNCENYREAWKAFRARFIAEEPQLGAISPSSLLRFMTKEDIADEQGAMWRYHTKSNPALTTEIFDISLSFAQSLLGPFASAEDRYFKLRYLQYEWIRLSFEQLRREMWFSSGIVYWMLNDCWPAASGWAMIDYYGKPKDGYYAFKRCAKPVVLSFDREGGELLLYASNQGQSVPNASVSIRSLRKGEIRQVASLSLALSAASSCVVFRTDSPLQQDEILVADLAAPGFSDRTFYRECALFLKPAVVSMDYHPQEHTLRLHADEYVHAVELEGEALFEDNCFSLLPGEDRVVSLRPLADFDEKQLCVTAYTMDFSK